MTTRPHRARLLQIASEMLLLFGLGTIAGPLAAGQAMRRTPDGLFAFVAVVLLAAAVAIPLASRRVARSAAAEPPLSPPPSRPAAT